VGPGYGCDSLVELEEEHVDSEDEMASLSPVVRRPLGVCSYSCANVGMLDSHAGNDVHFGPNRKGNKNGKRKRSAEAHQS